MNATKAAAVMAAVAGALGAASSAGAATGYSATSSSMTATLTGGPVVMVNAGWVTRCTSSRVTVSGMSAVPTPLPAVFGGVPAMTFGGCVTSIGSLPRPQTITTGGTWSFALGAADYSARLGVPSGGASMTLGVCTTTIDMSSVAGTLRSAAGLVPALGQPATRLALNGTLNKMSGPGCPGGSTMTIVADGGTVAGTTTGTYELSGAITED